MDFFVLNKSQRFRLDDFLKWYGAVPVGRPGHVPGAC